MNVVIVNPPLVQLNTPYPSGAYLSSFFKNQGCTVKWYDLSLELYYSIFSRNGLQKLFDLTSQKALKMAEQSEQNGDEATAFNLRRYVSTAPAWISWIDTINAILCGKGREKEHQFLYSPFAPRGARMETFLAGLDHEPSVDDVRFLCSYALADLADYITAVFDPDFSLIRYAESVAADKRPFAEIEAAMDFPVMKEFYAEVLGGESLPLAPAAAASSATPSTGDTPVTPPDLILISIPFAGTLVPALCTARFFRKKYPAAKIVIGGGYVNTEMREWTDPVLGKYIDYISYDRGYGSYLELLKRIGGDSNRSDKNKTAGAVSNYSEKNKTTGAEIKSAQIYKLLQFIKTPAGEIKILQPEWNAPETEKQEAEITRTTFPDYSDIDFSRYPRVCDDKNPMHRMWSDGAWIKAYLAHGCYWHRCAFCDTKLDYVCGYKIVDVEALYEVLLKTAREKGIYGIHFVDEALPPAAVLRFALCNARHGNPLYFWGNVRFEKAWTKDLAALLSACGFGGVSAGIEVATGQGLKNINKGTDIQSIVSACAAFKEAGILVHAYMIYGFWYDTPQTIIDSMETLRQFYAAGLLDSSFWHQFMLTRYSPKYDELKNSFNPRQYEKYGPSLDAALESWMHGEKLEMKVQKWFSFPMPSPTIPRDFVEKCIEKYEAANNAENAGSSSKNAASNTSALAATASAFAATASAPARTAGFFWLGSKPVIVSSRKNSTTLRWIYLQEEMEVTLPTERADAETLIENLEKLSPVVEKKTPVIENDTNIIPSEKLSQNELLKSVISQFKNKGLIIIS